jgi:hypothetical protein
MSYSLRKKHDRTGQVLGQQQNMTGLVRFRKSVTTMPHTVSIVYRNEYFPVGWNPPTDASMIAFYDCTFTEMPTEWPPRLDELAIDTCKCSDNKPWRLPESLSHLTLGYQDLCPDYLPSGLQSLRLRKFWGTTLPALPSGLKKLTLLRGRMTEFPSAFPPTLEYLHLYQSGWRSLPQLPDTLIELVLEEQWLDKYPVGSPDLVVRYDSDCDFGDT